MTALDRLKEAVAAAGPEDHALAAVLAGDVKAVLSTVPPAVLAAFGPDPANGPLEHSPGELLKGVAKLPPQTPVLQLAKQLGAAIELVPATPAVPA